MERFVRVAPIRDADCMDGNFIRKDLLEELKFTKEELDISNKIMFDLGEFANLPTRRFIQYDLDENGKVKTDSGVFITPDPELMEQVDYVQGRLREDPDFPNSLVDPCEECGLCDFLRLKAYKIRSMRHCSPEDYDNVLIEADHDLLEIISEMAKKEGGTVVELTNKLIRYYQRLRRRHNDYHHSDGDEPCHVCGEDSHRRYHRHRHRHYHRS